MNRLLASVRNIEEALLALQAGADIIDLKQPANGALGALDSIDVKKIVTEINGRCPLSATIGDLIAQPDSLFNAVQIMAQTGVDFVKIGFFPENNNIEIVTKLSELTTQYGLIAVLFADAEPDFNLIDLLKLSGFKGVMLDTMNKSKGSLTHIMPLTKITEFVKRAKTQNLLCGLAGSLTLNDVELLMPLQADYLGFRGALCQQHQRTEQLDSSAISRIKQKLSH